MLAAALLAPLPAQAATDATVCELRGFATDRDRNGTNIRAAPGFDAAIVGHLPPLEHLSETDLVGVEFAIVGSKNNWLHIRGSATPNGGTAQFDGWIPGGLAGVTLGEPVLHAAPRRDAPVVAWLSRGSYGPDSYRVTRIHACQGTFVEVTAKPPGGREVRGWSREPCANQLTTCDWSGHEPSMPPTPEVWRDEASTVCLPLAGEANTACTVEQFGKLGTVYVTTLHYASYRYADAHEPARDYRRVVILEDNGGRLHQLFVTAGDPAVTYDKPRIIEKPDRMLLHIPGHESGTGDLNREVLFVWRDYQWRRADTSSWLGDLADRLPGGVAVWKGGHPDYAAMTAETPVWRKGDGNACPTGGRAAITLGWRGDRVILQNVRLLHAGECGEPLPRGPR